ncbi:translocation/assembly module TamB domain-containing protein [Marinimicrobium alkaliphilum]|uniref:translocation/assembly module TamB domain-containing protein n=1 Tax=Marinimicrobium alkaliphilum TaxID=2202654 RepID=UPI000DBA98AF|nr:translocation/assembly module TamB domain-containing protein [Marinimicrobium alkaliphilum]
MRWVWLILRWLRFTLLSVLAIFVTLVLLVSLIVATEPGSRWAINTAVERIPMVELGTIEGNMLTGLDVSYVDYALDEQHYRIEELSFRWQPLALLYRSVSVQSLEASRVTLVLPAGAEADPEPTDWSDFEWPSLALPVQIQLGGLALRDITLVQGDNEFYLESVSGSYTHGSFSARVDDLEVVAPAFRVNASARLGVRHPYAGEVTVDWHYDLPMGEDEPPLRLAGQGELDGNIDDLRLRHQLQGPVALDTRAQIELFLLEERNPRVSLDNRWLGQSPPERFWTLDQPLPVSSGRLQWSGWLDDYRVQLNLSAAAEGLPPLALVLDARGDLAELQIDTLQATLAAMRLNTNGWLAWAEPATERTLAWDLALSTEDINPGDWLEDWPGQVSASLRTRGAWAEDYLDVQVEELDLSGQLRDLALSGSGAARFADGRLETEGLAVGLGENRLQINGHWDDTFDLSWQLTAPGLGDIDPDLSGTLNAEGRLSGDWESPALQLALAGDALGWRDYAIDVLAIDVEQTGSASFRLAASAEGLQLNEQRLEQVTLTGDGSLDDHRVALSVNSETYGQLALSLGGSYGDEQWQGQFDAFELRMPEAPRVWLLSSDTLVLGPERAEIGRQCLTTRIGRNPGDDDEPPGALCVDGVWDQSEGTALNLAINSFSLRMANLFLGPEATIGGYLEGQGEFVMRPGLSPEASLSLHTRDGEFRYQYEDDDLDVYAWERLELSARWVDNEINADFITDWAEYGDARARLQIAMDSRALDGDVQVRFGDLTPLEALVPRLHQVGGDLSADIRIAGTLDTPEVQGQLVLQDGTAMLPELGLEFTDAGVRLNSDQSGLVTLEGEVTSGEGTLTLSAEGSNLIGPDWQLSGSLEGEDFQVIRNTPLEMRVSPSLNASASAEAIRVEGTARIPYGRANIQTVPASATRVSEDVVLVNGLDEEAQAGSRIPLFMDIRLQLGDDVHFSGFGLESRLSGELRLLQTPARGLLTTGDVGVVEGRYRAYGQTLEIPRGRLIFQGPYDNPGLDIRAQRVITSPGEEDITVGLEIGGTLQRPRSTVYSTPTQPDSEAMSMLLTGRPLSGSSDADASMLVNAIGTLGLERSGFITAEIASTFGLDEFSLQAGDTLEESSLFIGKYITPRLFVRYVVGLFDQTTTMGMRYQLTNGLRLEAESGSQQSVDMIYNFER